VSDFKALEVALIAAAARYVWAPAGILARVLGGAGDVRACCVYPALAVAPKAPTLRGGEPTLLVISLSFANTVRCLNPHTVPNGHVYRSADTGASRPLHECAGSLFALVM